jgi:aminopeptidase YwaD
VKQFKKYAPPPMPKFILVFIFIAGVLFPFFKSDSQINEYFNLTRIDFNAEAAQQTVAYIEQRWRLAGNKGFNESIHYIEAELIKAGFVEETKSNAADRLTYRIEKRPMEKKTWEPVSASLTIEGEQTPLEEYSTNRNMIAIHSASVEKLIAEVVDIGKRPLTELTEKEVKGKILFGEASMAALSTTAIKHQAIGVLSYNMPKYTQPEKNINSIQFTTLKQNQQETLWGIALSYRAKERIKAALAKGPIQLTVAIQTNRYISEELTLIADVKGSTQPDQRFVYSAHVQEPGANDNASGAGTLTEMARLTAQLIKKEEINPARTITFLWGDEVISTDRYISDDATRAKGIKWGMSLDMVGQDTKKTGGTFLIEKMPDPSAIQARGNDKHTEWGASNIQEKDLLPHYFNDFVLHRCKEQGKFANWTVNNNPFEGGSDHTPFLKANIPGILLWHFTDMYYHTDQDRLEMVSKETMKNVGISTLVIAYTLASANEDTIMQLIEELKETAKERLKTEAALSKQALQKGAIFTEEQHILESWWTWYDKAIDTYADLPLTPSTKVIAAIVQSKKDLATYYQSLKLSKP